MNVTCEKCDATLTVPDDKLGRRLRCSQCRHPLLIDDPAARDGGRRWQPAVRPPAVRVPWYYTVLQVLAHVWVVLSVLPAVGGLVFAAFVLLMAVIHGSGSTGFWGFGLALWSLCLAALGLFSSIWAFAALVLCDIGINVRRGHTSS